MGKKVKVLEIPLLGQLETRSQDELRVNPKILLRSYTFHSFHMKIT